MSHASQSTKASVWNGRTRSRNGAVISKEQNECPSTRCRNEKNIPAKTRFCDSARSHLYQRRLPEVVLPRVECGDAIAIVTRKTTLWRLPDHRRVVRYSGAEARSAHLTQTSPGGRAILEQLLRGKK